MKKYSLIRWISCLLLFFFVSTQALATNLTLLNPDKGPYGGFNILAVGIANHGDCSSFSEWGNMFTDSGQDVCLGIALTTNDGWSASSESVVKVANNCTVPGLSSTNFISGNEVNIYVSYPSVSKNTVFSLSLSNSSTVNDQGAFTLTVTCTQRP